MKIAHLSDIHCGDEVPGAVDALSQRLADLRPDLVVISGDFTMAGRHREFADARRFISDLAFPVVAIPGNHDMPVYNLIERFRAPFARYQRAIAPIAPDRYESRAAAILGVNSARPWDFSFDWSHGRVSDEQVDEADRFFERHADAPFKALVVHHPFYVPEDMPGFRTLRNGEAMLEVLGRRNVPLVLSGHLHRQFAAHHTLTLDGADRAITVLQVATATSSRRRDQPNAFATIDVDRERFRITDEVFDGERFTPRSTETTNAA